MIRNFKQWCMIGCLLLSQSVFALIDIQITQGVDDAIPITVNNFLSFDSKNDSISSVIRKDLQFTGEFRLMPANVSLTHGELSKKQSDTLYNSGVEAFVSGQITSVDNKQYQIKMQLFHLYTKKSKQYFKHEGILKPIISKVFIVSKKQMHALAHHLSDLIYNEMTQEKGYFSTKIAYVKVSNTVPKEYALEIADYDGKNADAILISKEPILSPAWSPDGQQLAYVSFEGKQAGIYIAQVFKGTRQLISRSKGINGSPAWSHDGKKLAVVLSLSGTPKIYIKELATGALNQITQGFSIDTEPKWTAQDQSLLFTSNRSGGPQIYEYLFNSKKVNRITFSGHYNAHVNYSPNNDYIVFSHAVNKKFCIAKMLLKDNQVKILSMGDADESPSIAPNGSGVIYSKLIKGKRILMFVNKYGNYHRTVLSSNYKLQEPAWSPFYF